MQLSKLTFSLASVVLILTFAFAAMPAMGHTEHFLGQPGHDHGPDGNIALHPTVTIKEAADRYTEDAPRSRSNLIFRVVCSIDGDSSTMRFDDLDARRNTIENGADVSFAFYDANDRAVSTRPRYGDDGINIFSGFALQIVAPGDDGFRRKEGFGYIRPDPDKMEWIFTLDLRDNQFNALSYDKANTITTIDMVVEAGAVRGKAVGYEQFNERTLYTVANVPPLLDETVEVVSDPPPAPVPGTLDLYEVTFRFGEGTAAPMPAFTADHIVITPAGLATVDETRGIVSTSKPGEKIAHIQLGYFPPGGPSYVTVGVEPGYATGNSITLPPPTEPAPRAEIEVSDHDAKARTFRIDVIFTPADKSDGSPGSAITGFTLAQLEVTDENDGDVTLIEKFSRNSENRYTASLQYAVFEDLPLTIKIRQQSQDDDVLDHLETSNPEESDVVPAEDPNTAPTFGSKTIDPLIATVGTAIQDRTLPEADDADGDTITYSLSPALPDGLRFVKSTRELSGTPTAAMDERTYTYTADDGYDGTDSAELTFDITVTANTAPTFGSEEIADVSAREGIAIDRVTLPEAEDADGDTITYSLSPALPDGLRFVKSTRELSGTPTAAMDERTYTYTADDGYDGTDSAELTFDITVTANTAPTFGSEEIADVSAREGIAIDRVTLPEAEDADGDTITYSLSPALPDGLRFVKSTRELSGTPEGPMATKVYTYTADDGYDGTDSATLTFSITVNAATTPTFLVTEIADVSAREGIAIVPVTLPKATDADGDTITYSLSPALPDGLRFDPADRELSGTPEGPMATKVYTYTASDDEGASAALMFDITVNADTAPTFSGQTVGNLIATVGTAIPNTILPTATDADGDTITYSLSPALPDGLRFDPADRELSGTPRAVTVPAVYTYTATAGRKSDSLRFTIQVNAAVPVIPIGVAGNRPPVFSAGSSIANINGMVGTPIPVQALPVATDPDGDDVTHTLSPQPPAWLTYSTGVLSGTPTAAMGPTLYRYEANDGNGGSVVLSFIIQVAAAPPSVPELPGTAQIDGPAISLPAATIGPNEFIVLQRNPAASGIYSEVNSVTVGFANLDHLFRDRGGMVLLGSGSANDLVFSEIMWGSDSSLSVPEHSQWIELYNTTSQTLQLSNYRLQFYSSLVHRTAGAIDEINTNGWSSLHGQSGRTQGRDTQELFSEPVEIISMYLKINYPRVERSQARGEQLKDFRDGSNHGHWAASARPSLNVAGTWRLATPGSKPRFMIHGASGLRQEVLISEFGNSSEDDYDWIELYNTTDKVVNLKKWELSYVSVENGVGKEKSLFRFPDNDSHRLPPKSFLVVASSDPKKSGNDLAAGIDITKKGVDQQGKGLGTWIGGGSGDDKNINALYTVRPFSLPNGTARMNIILRHDQGKLGKASHFEDVVGTLKVELRGPVVSGWTGYDANSETYFNTAFWPLHATGGPHGNVINHTGDEDFRAGRVYQRQDLGKGVRTGINENKLAIRGWTGIGYDLQADRNNENGGTPGYHKDSLKSKASEVAGDVSISEIMLATGTEEDIRPAATRLPQWIELYNASSTQGVNINNWYLELHNSNLDRDLNLSGTLRLPNITIPPNQTVMIVSNSALNSGNFSEARTINLYTNGTYRNTLNLRSRGDSVLSQEGFYIEIRDHENKHVDEIGNLGVSRRTGIASRGDAAEIWELPSLHSEDGHRTSLIRVYDDRTNQPGDGLLAESWRRASDTNFRHIPSLTYFGNHRDFGTPGYRGGGPLPVALSKFRPERLETGEVLIRWVTESELNNAGFNILRTEKKEGVFKQVNPELIQGQGTTSGRSAYKWTDTTAKPNVVYYYQIQDVSLDGQVQTLRISRLKGNISAAGKATTTWGRLKARE